LLGGASASESQDFKPDRDFYVGHHWPVIVPPKLFLAACINGNCSEVTPRCTNCSSSALVYTFAQSAPATTRDFLVASFGTQNITALSTSERRTSNLTGSSATRSALCLRMASL